MRPRLRRAGLVAIMSVGVAMLGIGTAPQVFGSGPIIVGVGGAAPSSATLPGRALTGTGDGGGNTGPTPGCDTTAPPSCDKFAIHLTVPAAFAAANDVTLTSTVTFSGPPLAGLDQFLNDSNGNQVASNTSSTSPSVVKGDKLKAGDYTLYVVGDVGANTTYTGTVKATSTPKMATGGPLPADISFAPSTVVSPMILGAEPQMSFERPQANSLHGAVDARRGFVDWPLSSRTNIGTLWRTINGGDSYRQLVAAQCPIRQRPNCFTGGGGDTVNRVNNYDGAVMFGDQEALAAEAYAQSNDHGDTFPATSQQVATAGGTGVDRQWISSVDKPGVMGGPIVPFELEGIYSYHIPGAGEYVSGITKLGVPGAPVFAAAVPVITDVGQSGPSRVDSTGGKGDGYFYQVYRTLTTGATMVASAPLSQYQSPAGYHSSKITSESAVIFPWIALDKVGNLYATWVSPADHKVHMKYSLIGDAANDPTRKPTPGIPGSKWSKDVVVNPPSLTSTIFPQMVAGDPGHVAIEYMGTPDYAGASSNAPNSARWWPWVAISNDAFSNAPTFLTGPVSHRVAHTGQICTNGTTCVGTQDRSLADMIDVTMDSEGRASAVYEDNNNTFARDTAAQSQQGSPYVMVAKLASGPSLLAGHAPFNFTYPTDYRSSPAGDATWPNVSGAANLPSLDILGAGVSVSGQQLKGRIDLADASATGMTRDLAAYNAVRGADLPAQRLQYVLRFATGKDVFYMAFDTDGAGATRAYGGKVDSTSAISNGSSNVGTTYDPQAAFPVTAEVHGKSLVFTAPMSLFGVKRGSTLYSLTGFSLAGPTNTAVVALSADGTILGIDRVIDASPPLDAVLGTSTLDNTGSSAGGAPISGGNGGMPNTSAGAPLLPSIPVVALVLGLGLYVGRRRRVPRG